MKNKLLYFILSISFFSYAQETKRVLFIGNSYTYFNNLPSLVSQAANSTGDTVFNLSSTPGGATLESHTNNGQTLSRIKSGNWDFVVLQEQSQRPSLDDEYVALNVYPFASQLNELILDYNPCGETLFYMTWGRKNGDETNCNIWPPVCTYEGMDDLLRERYLIMSEDNEAVASPVGAVWRYLRENHSEIELYDPDNSHPSLAGSYAGAITFYTIIFQKDPTLVSFNASLPAIEASKIKNAVKEAVFNNFSTWFIDTYQPNADFSYNNIGNLNYSFTNESVFSSQYLWQFGDGGYSTEENPIHEYQEEGTYEVSLTSNYSCGNYSIETKTINVVLGLNNYSVNSNIKIYPNPANHSINVETPWVLEEDIQFEIYSITGKKMVLNTLEFKDKTAVLDIRALKNGFYFLKITNNKSVNTVMKFFKNKD